MTRAYYSGRAIFDHLQKTAGMAVDDWLVRHLGAGTVTPLLTGHLRHLIERYGGNYPIISGHVLFDGTGLDPRYQYFTILREPVDRVISWLHYVDKNMGLDDDSRELKMGAQQFLKSEGEEATRTFLVSIDNFYVNRFSSAVMGGAAVADVRHNYFSHFIVPHASEQQRLDSAMAVVSEYDLVGFYDDLPQFISQLADLLRLTDYAPLRAVNVTVNRPARHDISENMLNNILKLTEIDREFYSKSKEVLDGRSKKPSLYLGVRPFNRDLITWNYTTGSIRPYWHGAYLEHYLAKDLFTKTGTITGRALVSSGAEGYLCHGPYLRLGPGRYLAVATGIWITGGTTCNADIVSDKGAVLHAEKKLIGPAIGGSGFSNVLEFVLDSEQTGIEFRLLVPEGHQVQLNSVTFLNQEIIHKMLGTESGGLSTASGDSVQRDLGKTVILPTQMFSKFGVTVGPTLQTASRDGFLCYGPYITLGCGRYSAKLVGSIGPCGLAGAYVEVVCDSGKRRIYHQPLAITPFYESSDNTIGQSWKFSLDQDVNDLEIRLWGNSQSEINLCGIVLHQIRDNDEHDLHGEAHDT
ncbi:MAG: hypothetical protein PHR16_17340 [Methylovulum sp.]|nr:hypothetical protein [Methylovulum sp.]